MFYSNRFLSVINNFYLHGVICSNYKQVNCVAICVYIYIYQSSKKFMIWWYREET